MSDISRFVGVNISAETRTPSQEGFGTACLMGYHTAYQDLARVYDDVDGAVADFPFATYPHFYNAINAYFGQNPRPTQLVIGRTTLDDEMTIRITPNAADLRNLFTYTVYVGGYACSYTSDATASATEICAGLKIAIDAVAVAHSFDITVTNNTSSFDIAADTLVARVDVYIPIDQIDLLALKDNTPHGSIATDIASIRAVNDDWYALSLINSSAAAITAAAAVTNPLDRILCDCVADQDTMTSSTSDIMSLEQTAGHDHVIIMYHNKANVQYPAMALLGKNLAQLPGTITWKFKELAGVDKITLTADQRTKILGKNGMTYQLVAGYGITEEGKVSAGEFIDIIHGLDWQVARISEAVFGTLANSKKIGYSDNGVSKIKGAVLLALMQGVGTPDEPGLYKEDPGPTVSNSKTVAQVPTNERALRQFNYITFTAEFEGAIHYVGVNGRITV